MTKKVQAKTTAKATKTTATKKTAPKKKVATKEVAKVEVTPSEEVVARKEEALDIKKAIENQTNGMKVIITGSTHGKLQQRMTGSRKIKNPFGHFYGTIGSKIDRLIEHGAFTKKQIEAYAGTKMTKVNSHIAHLRKDVKKVVVIDPKTKKVSFG